MGMFGIINKVIAKSAGGASVIYSQLGWSDDSGPVGSKKDALVKSYSKMPWLASVAGKIADNVAAVPWYFVVAGKNGKPVKSKQLKQMNVEQLHNLTKKSVFDITEVYDHPLLDILSEPNEWMTGFDLFKLTSIHLDLAGCAYWYVSGDVPNIKLYPIPPAWILSLPNKVGDPYKLRMDKKTTIGSDADGMPKEIPYERVIPFRSPKPSSPYRGTVGIAESVSDELATDEYAAKYIKAFFLNGARPDIVVSGTGLSITETERAEARWTSKLRGYLKSHAPYFLSKSVTVTELGKSFKDMDIVNLRKWQRDIVMQVFGIPPEILGVLESSNRATISAASYLFTKQVVMPRLDKIRKVLQYRLVPMFNDTIILAYASPVEEDKEFRLKVMEVAPWCWTIDQWREIVGDPPLRNNQGEHVMIPAQYVPTHVDNIEDFISPYTADGLVTTDNSGGSK